MDNYGEPIIENDIIIGYKINDDIGVTVNSSINTLGNKINNVRVKELKNNQFLTNDHLIA
jgi:hypothetical protein